MLGLRVRPDLSGVAWALALAFLAAGGALRAQQPELHYTLTGDVFADHLGWNLAPLGDVDRDGVPDFAASVPEDRVDPGGEPAGGKVVVISGKRGEPIHTLRSVVRGARYGSGMGSGGDFDGDGVWDLLIHGSFVVELRSGQTGNLIRILRDRNYGPHTLVLRAVGDVDGDGMSDFAIGNIQETDFNALGRPYSARGRVTVHSGSTGEVLWTRRGEEEGDFFGAEITPVGDVNGDSVPDLAAGSVGPWTPSVGRLRPGKLYVLSGADGTLIYTRTTGVAGDFYASDLASLRDVDGDGVREIAVGAPLYPWGDERHLELELPKAGRVELLSGRTGERLWSVGGQDPDRLSRGEFFFGDTLGGALANAGDADGDGVDDLLISAGRGGSAGQDWGRAYLRSGRDGSLLAAFESERDHTVFGGTVSGLGDIDGDGRSEFLIAAPRWRVSDELSLVGRVYVMGYTPSGRRFIRGDADANGRFDIADAITLLNHLFLGGPAPCREAMDFERNSRLNSTDAVRIVLRLFLGGRAPEPPFPDCGHFASFKPQLPCDRSACP